MILVCISLMGDDVEDFRACIRHLYTLTVNSLFVSVPVFRLGDWSQ